MSVLNLINDNFSQLNTNIEKTTNKLADEISDVKKMTTDLTEQINIYDPDKLISINKDTDNNYNLLTITYGNGIYMAAGYDGYETGFLIVYTSTDGVNWNQSYKNDTYTIYTAISSMYVNDMFFIFCYNSSNIILFTSIDGVEWNVRTLATNMNSMMNSSYINDEFVIVGSESFDNKYQYAISYSSDSINWNTITFADKNISNKGGYLTSITYENGMYVAVGYYLDSEYNTYYRLMYSTNGRDFTQLNNTNKGSLWSVTYGNGMFIAVGTSESKGIIMTSKNGIDWSSNVVETIERILYVTYVDEMFVTVGNRYDSGTYRYFGALITSKDGNNFDIIQMNKELYFRSVLYKNNNYIITSNGNNSENKYILNILQPSVTYSKQTREMLELIYPVGITISLQTNTNPSTYLGFGTWEKISTGEDKPYTFERKA